MRASCSCSSSASECSKVESTLFRNMNSIQEKKAETTDLLQKHRDILAKTIAHMDEAIRKLEYEEQMIVYALQKRSEQNSRNR